MRISKQFYTWFIGVFFGGNILWSLYALFSPPTSKGEAVSFRVIAGALMLPATIAIFVFIYKMWQALEGKSTARMSPGKAVGFSFIPIYNFYWIFQVYKGFAVDYNTYLKQEKPKLPPLSEKLLLAMPIVTLASLFFSYLTPFLSPFFRLAQLVVTILVVQQVADAVNRLQEDYDKLVQELEQTPGSAPPFQLSKKTIVPITVVSLLLIVALAVAAYPKMQDRRVDKVLRQWSERKLEPKEVAKKLAGIDNELANISLRQILSDPMSELRRDIAPVLAEAKWEPKTQFDRVVLAHALGDWKTFFDNWYEDNNLMKFIKNVPNRDPGNFYDLANHAKDFGNKQAIAFLADTIMQCLNCGPTIEALTACDRETVISELVPAIEKNKRIPEEAILLFGLIKDKRLLQPVLGRVRGGKGTYTDYLILGEDGSNEAALALMKVAETQLCNKDVLQSLVRIGGEKVQPLIVKGLRECTSDRGWISNLLFKLENPNFENKPSNPLGGLANLGAPPEDFSQLSTNQPAAKDPSEEEKKSLAFVKLVFENVADDDLRRRAISLLANRGDSSYLVFFRDVFNTSQNKDVLKLAIYFLGKHGDSEDIENMQKMYSDSKDYFIGIALTKAIESLGGEVKKNK